MPEIKNRNLEQLKQYVAWEKEDWPDDQNRLHVLDWAIMEIERLRAELNAKQNENIFRYKKPKLFPEDDGTYTIKVEEA